jgi:hypothetical protein
MHGWDAHAFHGLIDFSVIVEQPYERDGAISQVSLEGLTFKNEAFPNWSGKLRWVETFHDAKTASGLSNIRSGSRVIHGSNDLQLTVRSGPTQDLPTPLTVAIDSFLLPFVGFEDFLGRFQRYFTTSSRRALYL